MMGFKKMVLFEEGTGSCGVDRKLCVRNELILRNIFQLCVSYQAPSRQIGDILLLLMKNLQSTN
jgi:hypothetical protein